MLSVQQVLTRLKIDNTSRCGAVQDVRTLIESSENPLEVARSIINNLTVIGDYSGTDPTIARMTAQRLVDEALVLGDKYDPEQALLKVARRIAETQVSDPYFFTKNQSSTVVTTTENREGVSVEVKTDGKIKKGGKQVLAAALYEKHKALSNKEIIEIFMKELDMSKPGATTYLYNQKKAAK